MAIKRRRIVLTIGTDGATTTASGTLTLGAAYGLIRKVEVKGDDTNVDTTVVLTFTDAEGRIVVKSPSMDFGPDDSTIKSTNQVYSTVGASIYPVALETDVYDTGGDPSANTEGVSPPVVAASPVTIAFSGGTDTDAFQTTLYVEV